MSFIHEDPHPEAGEVITVEIDHPHCAPVMRFRVEDWFDRVAGKSWMICDGNPAAMIYAIRSGKKGLPTDNEVVYGHDEATNLGHIIHVSELVPNQAARHLPRCIQLNNLSDHFLTKTEVAEFLGLSPRTIDGWVSRRKIPFTKINRSRRFRVSEIETWIAEQNEDL